MGRNTPLLYSTGFVYIPKNMATNPIKVSHDSIIAELYDQIMDREAKPYRNIKFLEQAVEHAVRLMGSDIRYFFETQLDYGKLDGMRLLFLEDTIKSYGRILKGTEDDNEVLRYRIRDIDIDQWVATVSRNQIYSAANSVSIKAELREFLKTDYGYTQHGGEISVLIKSLLLKNGGLKDLVKTLYIMFGQEVEITQPIHRSAKNPNTQRLVNHLKQAL